MSIKGKFNGTVFSIGIAIFLFISLFGALHLGMGSSNSMNDCPFSVGTSICTMTPLEHIGAAQNLINTLPSPRNIAYFFLLIISVVLLLALYFLKLFSPPKLSLAYHATYNRRSSPPPNFLQQAFSSGILNSKTF